MKEVKLRRDTLKQQAQTHAGRDGKRGESAFANFDGLSSKVEPSRRRASSTRSCSAPRPATRSRPQAPRASTSAPGRRRAGGAEEEAAQVGARVCQPNRYGSAGPRAVPSWMRRTGHWQPATGIRAIINATSLHAAVASGACSPESLRDPSSGRLVHLVLINTSTPLVRGDNRSGHRRAGPRAPPICPVAPCTGIDDFLSPVAGPLFPVRFLPRPNRCGPSNVWPGLPSGTQRQAA